MIEFNFETNANNLLLKIPVGLKLKENILQDIAEIVRKNIESNIRNGMSFNGTPLKPNKKGTQLFYQTGKLFNSVLKQKVGNNAYEIFIGNERTNIGKYQHFGTYKGGTPRPFFGIGKTIQEEVNNYLHTKKFSDLF